MLWRVEGAVCYQNGPLILDGLFNPLLGVSASYSVLSLAVDI